MEDPDVVDALSGFAPNGIEFDPLKATYFIGRETPFATEAKGMPIWREKLFEVLDRGAASAARFFNLRAIVCSKWVRRSRSDHPAASRAPTRRHGCVVGGAHTRRGGLL
ncbi:MAG: hypothetical protein WKF58_15585 [Ilumatobacteraceae bacterium]